MTLRNRKSEKSSESDSRNFNATAEKSEKNVVNNDSTSSLNLKIDCSVQSEKLEQNVIVTNNVAFEKSEKDTFSTDMTTEQSTNEITEKTRETSVHDAECSNDILKENFITEKVKNITSDTDMFKTTEESDTGAASEIEDVSDRIFKRLQKNSIAKETPIKHSINEKNPNEFSIQQNFENVSFDVVCSTPMVEVIPSKLLNHKNDAEYLGFSTSKTAKNGNCLEEKAPLEVKASFINEKSKDCIKVVGVEESMNFSNIQHSTPVNYVTTRRGRPPRTLHCVRDISKITNEEIPKTKPTLSLAVGELSVSVSAMCQ